MRSSLLIKEPFSSELMRKTTKRFTLPPVAEDISCLLNVHEFVIIFQKRNLTVKPARFDMCEPKDFTSLQGTLEGLLIQPLVWAKCESRRSQDTFRVLPRLSDYQITIEQGNQPPKMLTMEPWDELLHLSFTQDMLQHTPPPPMTHKGRKKP